MRAAKRKIRRFLIVIQITRFPADFFAALCDRSPRPNVNDTPPPPFESENGASACRRFQYCVYRADTTRICEWSACAWHGSRAALITVPLNRPAASVQSTRCIQISRALRAQIGRAHQRLEALEIVNPLHRSRASSWPAQATRRSTDACRGQSSAPTAKLSIGQRSDNQMAILGNASCGVLFC